VIPTGWGRIFVIAAALALVAYLLTGEGLFGIAFVCAAGFAVLHFAYSGGWGHDSQGGVPPAEATLGGQRGSAAQWVWYLAGVILFLIILMLMAGVAWGT
jgi:hypothetical protein